MLNSKRERNRPPVKSWVSPLNIYSSSTWVFKDGKKSIGERTKRTRSRCPDPLLKPVLPSDSDYVFHSHDIRLRYVTFVSSREADLLIAGPIQNLRTEICGRGYNI